jgi:hypothetical protein
LSSRMIDNETGFGRLKKILEMFRIGIVPAYL